MSRAQVFYRSARDSDNPFAVTWHCWACGATGTSDTRPDALKAGAAHRRKHERTASS